MLPIDQREGFYDATTDMARTLRRLMAGRLLGMAVEGFFIWIALTLVGVPMAGLLGLITGILAFLPNIGAIVSGVLTILVGFSAGTDTGLLAIGVYAMVVNGIVHIVDGVVRRQYNPGLVTSIVLFLPIGLGGLVAISATGEASPAQHLVGLAIALAIHVGIVAYVLNNARRLGAAKAA